MLTKQKRYEQTEKGKKARRRATANYEAKFVEWKTRLEPDVSAALEQKMPKGMSRSIFVKKIFQEYLDK
jgi:hypothetical protein